MQWQVGCSGTLHETIIVRVEAELKEGGAGPGTNRKRESFTDSEPAVPAPFVLCTLSDSSSLAAPFPSGLRGGRLGLTVILNVGLRRFRCVVRCAMLMTVRQLCVVGRGLVFACLVVSCRFFVVSCCVFGMFCRFTMMLCCLL
jgi:hypothetical protein